MPGSMPRTRVLSVSQQCELLGLGRSSYYYEPATESAENLALMALIDREYTAHPVPRQPRHDGPGCGKRGTRSIANGCSG